MKEKVSRTIDKKVMDDVRTVKHFYNMDSESAAMENILEAGLETYDIKALREKKKKKLK